MGDGVLFDSSHRITCVEDLDDVMKKPHGGSIGFSFTNPAVDALGRLKVDELIETICSKRHMELAEYEWT